MSVNIINLHTDILIFLLSITSNDKLALVNLKLSLSIFVLKENKLNPFRG